MSDADLSASNAPLATNILKLLVTHDAGGGIEDGPVRASPDQVAAAINSASISFVQKSLTDVTPVEPINAIVGGGYGPGDSPANIAGAIDAAMAYAKANGRPILLRGVKSGGSIVPWVTSTGHILDSNMYVEGDGETTLVKLANGVNAPVFHSRDIHTKNITIRNLSIDGNRSNNTTSADGIILLGLGSRLEDIHVTNVAGSGVVTDWDYTDAASVAYPVFGCYQRVAIDTCGKHGWYHGGPGDSVFVNCHVIDASLSSHGGYSGFQFVGSARCYDVHYSNRDLISVLPNAGLMVATSGCNFSACHFEGGTTPLLVSGTGNNFAGCYYYAPRGSAAVILYGAGYNRLTGTIGGSAPSANPNYIGIYLSTATKHNIIDLVDIGCNNGAIDFGASGGGNAIRIRGVHSSGPGYLGTPHATDDVNLLVGGASSPTSLRQSYP